MARRAAVGVRPPIHTQTKTIVVAVGMVGANIRPLAGARTMARATSGLAEETRKTDGPRRGPTAIATDSLGMLSRTTTAHLLML